MSKDSRTFYPVAPLPRNQPIPEGSKWRRPEFGAPAGPSPRSATQAKPVPQSPLNAPTPRNDRQAMIAANVAQARARASATAEARRNSQEADSSR